jgi:hypothetical protein
MEYAGYLDCWRRSFLPGEGFCDLGVGAFPHSAA